MLEVGVILTFLCFPHSLKRLLLCIFSSLKSPQSFLYSTQFPFFASLLTEKIEAARSQWPPSPTTAPVPIKLCLPPAVIMGG